MEERGRRAETPEGNTERIVYIFDIENWESILDGLYESHRQSSDLRKMIVLRRPGSFQYSNLGGYIR